MNAELPPRCTYHLAGRQPMKIDGHCHCGRISFEAEVDPTSVTICHCADCQRLTGSAFRANIVAPAAQFVLRGTPRSYVKTAESGNQRRHAFCGDCGTPIYACAMEDRRAIRSGSALSPSAPTSHCAGKSGGVQRWRGSTRSLRCRRARKDGRRVTLSRFSGWDGPGGPSYRRATGSPNLT